ncbi:MAG: glycine--tRNA ligase subunit beta [Cyanobacteriota bacterium]
MATFLLEIGTEELPADFARLALPQLEERVVEDLRASRLPFSSVHVTSTPRRLALTVADLGDRQADLAEERKGPPAQQAFRDGVPTPAVVGFANRCGIDPAALEIRETPKGPFVFAQTLEPGRPTAAVLPDLVPAWIRGLQGRRFMRWGEGESRFSRPVRWLVALLDDQVVPIQLSDCDPVVVSGRTSRGHRLELDPVEIATAEAYAPTLAAVDVQVERLSRARWIRQELEQAAALRQADIDLPASLFDELVDLVESPRLIEGEIDADFLALPPEVLSTVMRAHQRYVPLLLRDRADDPLALDSHSSLLPAFLCVGNGRAEAAATIQRGNERVLRARLADAEFFVRADRGTASIDRRDALDRVTFAEGLGSLRDRTERIEWCTDVLLQQLPIDAAEADHARRAAHLCKHDLVSQMVGEFPELQGVIGGKYLLAEGEPRAVALAVQEHYLPRGAGDQLPGSAAGAVVALAERLELLLSIYAKGERPSGSSDPYALRRAGNGVLQILWHHGWSLNLQVFLERACGHWAALFPGFGVKPQDLHRDLAELLRQRLVSLLEEEGIDADLVQAVAGEGLRVARLLADPADARQRARLLQELRGSGALAPVQAVVQRAARLAEKGDLPADQLRPDGVVDRDLFSSPSELAMLEVLQRLEPFATGIDPGRYLSLAQGLSDSATSLGAFFDGEQSVLVMAEDPAVRRNRLHLLGILRNQASVLADFSRIC